jgi:hypothetical protein
VKVGSQVETQVEVQVEVQVGYMLIEPEALREGNIVVDIKEFLGVGKEGETVAVM